VFDLDLTFIWTAVNLAVIYFFVRRFLFKRLAKNMDARAAAIAEGLSNGEALTRERAAFQTEREEWKLGLDARRSAFLDAAKADADLEAARIVSEAREEAARMKDEAKGRIENERAAMLQSLTQETVRLAMLAATGVLNENMDDESNRALAEQFIKRQEAS
jgi:F-type H+-transporting ATPase subunit b